MRDEVDAGVDLSLLASFDAADSLVDHAAHDAQYQHQHDQQTHQLVDLCLDRVQLAHQQARLAQLHITISRVIENHAIDEAAVEKRSHLDDIFVVERLDLWI